MLSQTCPSAHRGSSHSSDQEAAARSSSPSCPWKLPCKPKGVLSSSPFQSITLRIPPTSGCGCCYGPGGSWWGIAALQGAPAGFSSKAHFLEAEQDAHAGPFGCSHKGQYLQEDSLLCHCLRGQASRNLAVQRFQLTQHEGIWSGKRPWIMGAGRPGEGSGTAHKDPTDRISAQNITSLESP